MVRSGVTAKSVDGRAPTLDGRLDDAVWALAEPASGFILREPTEGIPASEQTEVRFQYTDEALYIGARMFSGDPGAVRRIARRDREIPTEQLVISLVEKIPVTRPNRPVPERKRRRRSGSSTQRARRRV